MMKTIGLIGGMSWESSIEYYRMINEMVRARLGGLHSARSVMVSVDFAEIEAMQAAGRWDEAGQILAKCGQALEAAGADCIVLCTNTMHRVASAIEAVTTVSFIHIADPTAEAIKKKNLHKVGLLATDYTMTQDFYRGRLVDYHGLDVIVPPEADRKIVHDVIYDELCLGIIAESSKAAYLEIIERLVARGAEAIILGCTEVGLLVKDGDCERPLFDTTVLHAAAAVEFALTP
ncbi:MAG: aspartate/glutamate racemase family protein [Ardenticatenaceae bacterium]|nr:aspartate/glutamate racemase family protein [Ardenticatenaceae bacterium]